MEVLIFETRMRIEAALHFARLVGGITRDDVITPRLLKSASLVTAQDMMLPTTGRKR